LAGERDAIQAPIDRLRRYEPSTLNTKPSSGEIRVFNPAVHNQETGKKIAEILHTKRYAANAIITVRAPDSFMTVILSLSVRGYHRSRTIVGIDAVVW
jgi:hypothetical protein